MKTSAIYFSFFIFIFSCSNSDKYERIIGEWKCVSWTSEAKGMDKCKNNVYFKFEQNKTYISKIGSEKDSGSFRIQNEMLYVTPAGKKEFVVGINQLNNDTLVFLMNLAGEEEILTLNRKH